MKVLFVSSGNSENGISPVVKNQGESLRDEGIDIHYFSIIGRGLKGYFNNILLLRGHIKQKRYDIVHAHYSLSAFAATLAGCKPLVVSLMGSDIRLGSLVKFAIKLSSAFFWKGVIVKSENMFKNISLKNYEIIPNGVNTTLFKPADKQFSISSVGWNAKKRHILFAANPSRPEKNFRLLQEAYESIKPGEHIELHWLGNIPHKEIPKYFNAADVVVLTSWWEGSPNVIKEAMACNRPIVSTDVGDVRWVLGDLPGCYVASNDPADVTAKLKEALAFSQSKGVTMGRERIGLLGLAAESIAKRINDMYQRIGQA